jgi:hypothetical protein
MSLLLTVQFTQMLLAETSSCHNVGPEELIAITALLAGFLTFAATTTAPAIMITLGTVVTKILAGLGIGVTLGWILVPLDPFLDIAAVVAVVEGIKHILGCA